MVTIIIIASRETLSWRLLAGFLGEGHRMSLEIKDEHKRAREPEKKRLKTKTI